MSIGASIIDKINKSINGEEKLWKVFWIYWWLGVVLISAASNYVDEYFHEFGDLYFIAIFIPWFFWANISLWQCAFNAVVKYWGYLVRIIVIWQIGAFSYSIIGPLFLYVA